VGNGTGEAATHDFNQSWLTQGTLAVLRSLWAFFGKDSALTTTPCTFVNLSHFDSGEC
jgi:hypothetical protein